MADKEVRNRKKVDKAGDLENQEDTKKETPKVQRSVTRVIVQVLAGIVAVFCLYLVLAPSPIEPVSIVSEHPLPHFSGVLKPNTILQTVSKIAPGKLIGPESFEVDRDGNVYTGLGDGRVVKILYGTEQIVEIGRTGQFIDGCGTAELEETCGRPLGLHFDKDEDNLIICDAKGLLKMDIRSGAVTTLIPSSEGVAHVPFKFVNHLAISSKGVVYFTDSSWKWDRKDWAYLALEGGGQGRLMSYDLSTGESEVLMTGLFFPNGVALSPDEDFVLITETSTARIIRYFTAGLKKGIYDVFVDNLPGSPDNIRASVSGGYWVALPSIRKWPFSLLDAIGPYPALKKALAKVFPKHVFSSFVPNYGLVVKLDYYGDIVASYHDPDGSVISHISEVCEDAPNGVLYLGSFKNDFVGQLRITGDNHHL